VENFLTYAKSQFYEGTIFHRVIPKFMIQGGGFTAEMRQKGTRPPIRNEAFNRLKNLRGTIAMARTSAPDSATSQFFINHKDNPMLDYAGPGREGYAVFGKVVEGMEVVDKIAAVETTRVGQHGDVPRTPVVIESVEVID
jgi:cyclophilin family peptidyl-prolyl cis-trans isomerase